MTPASTPDSCTGYAAIRILLNKADVKCFKFFKNFNAEDKSVSSVDNTQGAEGRDVVMARVVMENV
jgi:hypothetical protein